MVGCLRDHLPLVSPSQITQCVDQEFSTAVMCNSCPPRIGNSRRSDLLTNVDLLFCETIVNADEAKCRLNSTTSFPLHHSRRM